jgi:c-di-GMP phosphodiesterase
MADRTGELLFESVVAIGHTLGLAVVAEGVETREQAALARRCGKVILQGYLLGRPLPIARFVELIADPAPLPR